MSQRIVGLDLGAHSVKVAALRVGFRTIELDSVATYEVAPEAAGDLERSLEVLSGIDLAGPTDVVCVGMPGDRLLMRTVDVPFSDPRQVQAVVAAELADDLPWELDEVMLESIVARVGDPALVSAVRRTEVSELLTLLSQRGIDARKLAAAPMSYAGLARRLYPEELVLLLDLGHLRTNLCLLDAGRPLLARTISRGGHQLTEALRQLLQLSYVEAEQYKHAHAFVVDDPTQLAAQEQRVAMTMARAIAPLVRETRRSIDLAANSSSGGPTRAVLCGGTSQLTGLTDYLAVELRMPVSCVDLRDDPELAAVTLPAEGQPVAVLPIALALDYGRRQSADFRRGDFARKADTSFWRDRIVVLAASIVAVLLFAALNVWASFHAGRLEAESLREQLSQVTLRVFGEREMSAEDASRRIKVASRPQSAEIPAKTALDVLELISRHMPSKAKVQLDVSNLDIRPGKTDIGGTANSLGAVGNIIEALKKVDCFSDVGSGKISEVAEGKKKFSLNITTTCF